ncbi:leucine-rich repeat domain-containing protein [Cryobacterium sp. TMS1-20-1]|uniref:leucine-rich repeat domain-containing protein n=1 Tax=Cryobacterium sp. TMS1-20-1 TaxID=1259223 RepID=UPI00141AD0E6|nr:leucine-rich repeat domain-containing protein [Cryobacterium sp. TMS1-20-1]
MTAPTFLAGNGITYGLGAAAGTLTALRYNRISSTVVIPDSVEHDGEIYLVTAIEAEAFARAGLTVLTIGANVTDIGHEAFFENRLTTVSLPNSLTHIGDAAFGWNRLSHLDIPASVTVLEGDAFTYNPLTSVTLHDGLTNIGDWTFAHTKLTAVAIPASVRSIGAGEFTGSPLASVTFVSAAPSIFGAELSSFDDGVTGYYQAAGFTSPTWRGYAAVAYS